MPSAAMEPTLHCAKPATGCQGDEEDRILVMKYRGDTPQRGDIVVFETPFAARLQCGAGGLFVKRVIGLPGENWRERAGAIFIDGKPLPEPWIRPARRDNQSFPGSRIGAGRYLLLGDNRAFSCDSRHFGVVPLANIRGKVVEIRRGSERIHLR
jgi:signal peptidase I